MKSEKFINGSDHFIMFFSLLGGGRGEGGEVGVEEEDSSIPMAQRHLTDNICVPSRDGEYQ